MEITKFSEKESVRIFEKSGKKLELAINMAKKVALYLMLKKQY